MTVVLDTSAVIAFSRNEPGADEVDAVIAEAVISTVNMAELVTKLVHFGYDDGAASRLLGDYPFAVHPFDADQARIAGLFHRHTRPHGLSLGDRSCLALAKRLDATVLTADRAWASLDLGVRIEVIR
ncbi:type II toxin-antitoxin system VapC family toxin [Jannaschia sp. LMIT008]|uniref:type II toxin-antitoxin system VapC family toxin n=1 Tax=Jannaschia maritima TaxID=3032585 RepID=UPI002810DCD1|nr:type II toxin-antitoxin system VapC family toxin [Jannaschia sp. LMIT008]